MANNNAKNMTNGTGIRIADALEGMSFYGKPDSTKIPVFTQKQFLDIAARAEGQGMTDTTEVTGSNALAMFLNGLEAMNSRGFDGKGAVAYMPYHFMNILIREAMSDMKSLARIQNGILTGIKDTPVAVLPDGPLPAGTAFLIIGKDLLDRFNDFVGSGRYARYYELLAIAQPTAAQQEELSRLTKEYDSMFHENEYNLFFHGGQPVLKDIPFYTYGSRTGRSTIVMQTVKEKNTNKRYAITAENEADLPGVTYGTIIDVTSAASGWYGAVQLDSAEIEITPPEGHTRIKVVEVLRNMKPVGCRSTYINIG